jgi:hypothetical protein
LFILPFSQEKNIKTVSTKIIEKIFFIIYNP